MVQNCATILILTVAVKNANAAIMNKPRLSTMSVRLVMVSPKITTVPAVMIRVINKNKTTFPTNP